MKKQSKRYRRNAFTLMEVLLVLVIIVIMGSFVGIYIRGTQQTAFEQAALNQINGFKSSIESYQLAIRSYPTTQQGLMALIEPPSDLPVPERWKRPFMEGATVPLDPWDREYQYELIDADTYRIWSLGPDGQDGTEDDISSIPAGTAQN